MGVIPIRNGAEIHFLVLLQLCNVGRLCHNELLGLKDLCLIGTELILRVVLHIYNRIRGYG